MKSKIKRYLVLDEVLVNVDDDIILHKGEKVDIELLNTPNGWPCINIDGELYDIALEENEFKEFFKEIMSDEEVIKTKAAIEFGMSLVDEYDDRGVEVPYFLYERIIELQNGLIKKAITI